MATALSDRLLSGWSPLDPLLPTIGRFRAGGPVPTQEDCRIACMSFKQLTRANWTERDPINEIFHHVDPVAGIASPLSGDDWAGQFLGVQLQARVPEDVQNLFAVARGAMVYGHFFYPLYTLGHEQLYRVADAATVHRLRELGGPPTKQGRPPRFVKRIEWLVAHGAISQTDARR